MTSGQRRALDAIVQCQTGAYGVTVRTCTDCGHAHQQLRSCGHRSCPKCQHHLAVQWIERQQEKLLPVPYFLITFTVPARLRPLAYRYPKAVYDALFAAASATIKLFGINDKRLQADIGACAVLHTHSRRLDYHPHLHMIVPGAAIDRTEVEWRPLSDRYLFNGRQLATVFRAKMIDALNRRGLSLPSKLPKHWVVNCKHVGRGLPAIKYLARYLYRGVVTERDLIGCDVQRQTVTFRYRDAKRKQTQLRTLSIADFLWRIVLHVLPRGYRRVRDYGFLHGNARRLRSLIQLLLRVRLPVAPPRTPRTFTCSECGAAMVVTAFYPASHPPRWRAT